MNEQQPTPERVPQPTPEIVQSVAAVGEHEGAEPPAKATPKPAPVPPIRPDSRLAVAPIPTPRQFRMFRQMSRTSALWRITVLGAVVCLLLAAFDLCTTPQEIWETIVSIVVVLTLSAVWAILMRILRRRPAPPLLWSEVRINELYPQGAVSRGESGTIVLPYEDITLYEETEDWLTLSGRGGAIAWSANDLTPPAATAIRLYLRARVPTSSVQIKGVFRARGDRLLPIPTLPPRGACFATATAETRPFRVAVLRFLTSWGDTLPPMWLLAISAGNLLCRLFAFSEELLQGPWMWFFGFIIAQGLALFIGMWIEAAAQKRAQKPAPDFWFCENGLWVSSGRGAVRFPRGTIAASRTRTGLEVYLPSGFVRLPYQTMSDRDRIVRYFDPSA